MNGEGHGDVRARADRQVEIGVARERRRSGIDHHEPGASLMYGTRWIPEVDGFAPHTTISFAWR
jgi:hypothetical protein